jgi:bifunctional DNA-binding transcriptional regulator/antitoxin component of YhaV-PrlF toxin-antitoxin module
MTAQGRIVIPEALRTKYGLTPGTRLQIWDDRGVLMLVPLPDNPVEALYGMLKDGPSLTADLLEDRASRDKA